MSFLLFDISIHRQHPHWRPHQTGAERGAPKEDAIITIDQSGADCAYAKVMIALGENHFTNYLTFLKLDGRWQIISKTFTAVPLLRVEPL